MTTKKLALAAVVVLLVGVALWPHQARAAVAKIPLPGGGKLIDPYPGDEPDHTGCISVLDADGNPGRWFCGDNDPVLDPYP